MYFVQKEKTILISSSSIFLILLLPGEGLNSEKNRTFLRCLDKSPSDLDFKFFLCYKLLMKVLRTTYDRKKIIQDKKIAYSLPENHIL
jgi:hypothetical protein